MRSICHFSSVHRVDDTRVFFREVKGLLTRDFDVTLVARKGATLPCENKLTTIIFPEFKSRLLRVTLGNLKMLKILRTIKADAYQFHDPELLLVGLCLRLFGKKVIYDIHEDVEKQILSKAYLSKFQRRMFSFILGGLERRLVKHLSGIVCVIPNMLENFQVKSKVLFRNLPDYDYISNAKPSPRGKKFRIIYPGSLSENRGIIDVLDAINMLGTDTELVLFGNFTSPAFEERCRAHRAWQFVNYGGRVPVSRIYSEIQSSDLGLQYVRDTPSYRVGYPVKVFEFLSAGLPTIISDIGNRRNLFGDYVIYAPAEKPEGLAAEINRVIENREKYKRQFSENAVSFRETYSYKRELDNYVLFLEAIIR